MNLILKYRLKSSGMKKILSVVLVIALIYSSLVQFVNPSFALAGPSTSWVTQTGYGKLGTSYGGFYTNYVAFKEISANYTSIAGRTIMLEDADDLYRWSVKCYGIGGSLDAENAAFLSANYVLGNNIDYTSMPGIIPIGVTGMYGSGAKFTGTFDGQGFEITNLSISEEYSCYFYNTQTCKYIGFFANIGLGGTVKNVGLKNPVYVENTIMSFGFFAASFVGYNEGRVEYCFVNASNPHKIINSNAQAAGFVHTNTGEINNAYFAGRIKFEKHTVQQYEPFVFVNYGLITSSCYDNSPDVYDGGSQTAVSGVTGYATAALKARTGCLTDDEWYTDDYQIAISKPNPAYPAGYPRLQGFKINNYAAANSASNLFFIDRPADLIFLSNAGTQMVAFINSTRYYKIRKCLNMNGVSEYAYKTPANTAALTMIGTVDGGGNCTCGHTHPGSGSQLKSHSIINLRISSIVNHATENEMYLGMFFNRASAGGVFTDINFVGGQLTVPPVTSAVAANRTLYVGMIGTIFHGAKLTNIHSSASIKTIDNVVGENYFSTVRVGGLVGDAHGGSGKMTVKNCSVSGDIDMGVHTYVVPSYASPKEITVGGMIGGLSTTASTSNYTTYDNLTNYGNVTGVTFIGDYTLNTKATYTGGLLGNLGTSAYISNLINYGDVTPVKKRMPSESEVIFGYMVGGVGAVMSAPLFSHESDKPCGKMYSSGTIRAYPVIDNGPQFCSIGGVFGAIAGSTSLFYTELTGAGKIYLSSGLNNFDVGGISCSAAATSPTASSSPSTIVNSANDTDFFGEDGGSLVLSPKYPSTISGLVGGKAYSTASFYAMRNCVNNKDIILTLNNAAGSVLVNGVTTSACIDNSENNGNISVTASNGSAVIELSGLGNNMNYITNSTNNGDISLDVQNYATVLKIGGAAASGGFLTDCVNNGKLTYTGRNHQNASTAVSLYVSGLSASTSSLSTTLVSAGYEQSAVRCVNNGDISVKRIGVTGASSSYAYTNISGVRCGNTATVVSDCVNNGAIDADFYYDTPAEARNMTANITISGVAYLVRSIERCVNNGDITVAKTQDFHGNTMYISGIVYSSLFAHVDNFMDSCVNKGNITNANNISSTLNSTNISKSFFFSGITYNASIVSNRCVNEGDILIDVKNTQGLSSSNYYLSGFAYFTSTIDAQRIAGTFGIKNIANTGNISFKHDKATLLTGTKVYISGIASYFGSGNIAYAEAGGSVVPMENLVNYGNIDVQLDTNNATYGNGAPEDITATYANLIVGGISAMPGYNPNSATNKAADIPLRACANLGNINVNLKAGSDSVHSTLLPYQIGGIAGSDASNTFGLSNQKLRIIDCVNGGNITLNCDLPTAMNNANAISGVGGILGFGYQRTKAGTAELQDEITTGVFNCVNFGNIYGGYSTGGIVGTDGSIIKNVLNFGTVTAQNLASAGGIVGAVRGFGQSLKTTRYYELQNAINYGKVVKQNPAAASTYAGGIIGNFDIAQTTTATLGKRVFSNLLNSGEAYANAQQSTAPMFGAALAQEARATVNNLYEIADSATYAGRASNYGTFFNSKITLKTVGDPNSDLASIYHPDFPWYDPETTNLSCVAYLTPEKSERNELVEGTNPEEYTPYVYGIYALSVEAGTLSGYYPSANIRLAKINPVEVRTLASPDSTNLYDNWMTNGGRTVQSKLASCRQIRVNDKADILALELESAGKSVYLRNAEVDSLTSTVTFYVIKDYFEEGRYIPFSEVLSEYTKLSIGATFEDGTYIDLPGPYSFDGTERVTKNLTIVAESGDTKDWTIEFVFKEDLYHDNYPAVLTEIREGSGITNSSAASAYTNHTVPAREGNSYNFIDEIPYTTTNLILFLDTVDLLSLTDRYNDVRLEKWDSEASVATPINHGSAANTGYYKTPTSTQMGTNSINYKIENRFVEDYTEYKDYTGRMTINLRLDSVLESGTYRIVYESVYGPTYFYFTREISSETNVLTRPVVNMVVATATPTIDNTNALLANLSNINASDGRISYGNAPDLRLLGSINDLFTAPLKISTNATVSPLTFVGVTDNGSHSLTYKFKFVITAESGVTREWAMELHTQKVLDEPATITANFNGRDYDTETVKNPERQNDTFFINELSSATFTVKYNVAPSAPTGGYGIYNVGVLSYFDFELYRNGVKIPKTEYGDDIVITKSLVGGQLTLDASLAASLPKGGYELRGYYVRDGAPIPITTPVFDELGNQYSQFEWENLQYTPFRFFKSIGVKYSYAVGFVAPHNPRDLSMTCAEGTIPWERTTGIFNYSILNKGLLTVHTEEYADYNQHRTFEIVVGYNRDIFYGSYKPEFILPEGATLYRQEADGDWVLVTEENQIVNMRGGRKVRYRVMAQDERFYQDYIVSLEQLERLKYFDIDFSFVNGASNTLPAVATFRSLELTSDAWSYEQVADFTIFSHPNKEFGVEIMPSGMYLLDVDVPYGYQASIICDGGSVLENTAKTPADKLISGQYLIDVLNRIEVHYHITIVVEPIPDFTYPWGIRRDSRG